MSDAAFVGENSETVEPHSSTAESIPVPELPGQLTFGWGDVAAPQKPGKGNSDKKKSKKTEQAAAEKPKRSAAKQKKKKAVKRKPVKAVESASRKGAKKATVKRAAKSKQNQTVPQTVPQAATPAVAVPAVSEQPAEAKQPRESHAQPSVTTKETRQAKAVEVKRASRTVRKKKKPVRAQSAKTVVKKRAVDSESAVKSGVAEHVNVVSAPSAIVNSSITSYADSVDSLNLKWGARLPSVGFGFWKVEKSKTAEICYKAIQVGYRHFDCACDYGNEAEVGQGIRRAIQDGLVEREDLWVTSKLWNTYHSPEHVRMACQKSLDDLQLEYLDLYLIHFPLAQKFVPIETRYPPGWFFDPDVASPVIEEARVPVQETWQAMEELTKEGLARNIGVCNFGTSQIRDLLTYAHIRPAVLQVETHPRLTQPKLLRYCQQEKIAYTSFSPLGAESYYGLDMAKQSESLLLNLVVKAIAEQVDRTAAQVLLRWGVQRGTAVIPKTSSQERMAENIRIFDFELSAEQMQQLNELDEGRRFNDPGDFGEAAFNTYLPIYE